MSTAASTVFSAYNKRVSQSGVKLGILSVEKDKGASSIKIMISVWERHLNIGRPLILTIHSMQVRSTTLCSYYAIDNYLSQAFDML